MLASGTGQRLVALSGDPHLDVELVNDAYKPRMHKLYAMLMPALQVSTLPKTRVHLKHALVVCFPAQLHPGFDVLLQPGSRHHRTVGGVILQATVVQSYIDRVSVYR